MATVPNGYIYKSLPGAWFAPDGTGPYLIDNFGNAVLIGAGISPEDQAKIDGGFPSNLALGAPTGTSQPILNSNGTGVVLVEATPSYAGLLSAFDKGKLNNVRYSVYGGPWAGRPTASSNTGMLIVITDIGVGGRTWFQSDGTNWRPLNGEALLYQLTGGISNPIATVTTVSGATQMFTLPQTLRIPAGLIFAGCSLHIRAVVRRASVGASPVAANGIVWLNGVDQASTGQQFSAISLGVAVGNTVSIESDADINSLGFTTYPQVSGQTGASVERPLTIANEQFVYCGASASFETGASIQLLALQVLLRA